MKKIILCFLLLFLTCGCQANYSLDIDEVENFLYKESLNVKSDNYQDVEYFYLNNWPLNAYDDEAYSSESIEKIPGVSYYQVEKSTNQPYNITYSFEFPAERFSHSNGIRVGFPNFKVFRTNDEVTLDTGVFQLEKFPTLEVLNISVKVNKKVISHNADEVVDNTYYWHLSREDLKKRTLQLTYFLGNNNVDWIENHKAIVILGFFALFLVLLIGLIIIKNMKK